MAFLAGMGEGEDYGPRVWDSWLTGEQGVLAVGRRRGQVVVQGHLMDLGQGGWWLEGLRVRPEVQGQGIGSHFHDYVVERWLGTAGRVVRLATKIERMAVHRMCQRTDFERVMSFARLEMDCLPEGPSRDRERTDDVGFEPIAERPARSEWT